MSKRKTRILIIDDEEDFCLFVRKNLELAGNYKVLVATTSEKGIWSAGQDKPDLILLDIMMPGTPVTEVVKKISDIKIAFMSVVRISDARKRGLCTQD
ncbi:response regulator, partial [bacterium]|nr:response regulator [bacterium]